jgi:hypothetical protein
MKAADRKLIGELLDADETLERKKLGRFGRSMPRSKKPDLVYGEDF